MLISSGSARPCEVTRERCGEAFHFEPAAPPPIAGEAAPRAIYMPVRAPGLTESR
ncbi:hypothetical protein [Cystobacter fuscus]|uniref:hypothetical protein n=1 Tax=Cystobacter fuscus TaxID=43 RepID=UPI0037C136B8